MARARPPRAIGRNETSRYDSPVATHETRSWPQSGQVAERRLAGAVDDDRPDHGQGAGDADGEHREPVQEQGQRREHDDQHPEEGQHHQDLVVERLEQHPEHDEDQPALEVVAQELQGQGAPLAQLHAHRDADDHGEQRGGEVLREVEDAAHRAQVRDEHRHDRQPPGGVEAVEAAGRRHAPSVPVESREHAAPGKRARRVLYCRRGLSGSAVGNPSAHRRRGRRSPPPGRRRRGPGGRPTPTRTRPGRRSPRP